VTIVVTLSDWHRCGVRRKLAGEFAVLAGCRISGVASVDAVGFGCLGAVLTRYAAIYEVNSQRRYGKDRRCRDQRYLSSAVRLSARHDEADGC